MNNFTPDQVANACADAGLTDAQCESLLCELHYQPAKKVGDLVALSEQQVCDMLREKKLLTDKGMRLVLNGDFVSLNVTAITSIVNAALAAQTAADAAADEEEFPLTMTLYGTRELLEQERQRRASKKSLAPDNSVPAPTVQDEALSEVFEAAKALYAEHEAACATDPMFALLEMAEDDEEANVSAVLLANLFRALAAHHQQEGGKTE